MRRFWNRPRRTRDLGRKLRRERPEAPAELVATVASRVRGERGRRPAPARVAFAAGLGALLLVALAATGGMSYAASAGGEAIDALQEIVQPSSSSADNAAPPPKAKGGPAAAAGKKAAPAAKATAKKAKKAVKAKKAKAKKPKAKKAKKRAAVPGVTPAQAQYKVTICHRTGSQRNPGVTITVSQNALPAHERHGDTVGPCQPRP